MSLGCHSEQIVRLRRYVHIQKKRGASLCHSLHVLRPWNCPISRNEQRRKPHDDIYSQQTRTTSHNIRLQKMFRMQCIYTPQGVPVALFLTDHLNFPGSKTSKPKRTVTPFMYMSPTLAFPHEGLSARIGFAKVRNKLVIQN